jgi:hypothetical protein
MTHARGVSGREPSPRPPRWHAAAAAAAAWRCSGFGPMFAWEESYCKLALLCARTLRKMAIFSNLPADFCIARHAHECRALRCKLLNSTPCIPHTRCLSVNIYHQHVICSPSSEPFRGIPLPCRRFQRFCRRRWSSFCPGAKQLFHGQHPLPLFRLTCPSFLLML